MLSQEHLPKVNGMRRLVALAAILTFIFSGLSASTAGASGCSLDQVGTVVTGIGTCTGEVTIPNGITAIGNAAFSGETGLTGITISNSVTSIGAYAFEGATALTSVTMGSGVISIGEYAFLDARALTSVVIPNSVTSMGDGVFGDARALTSVTIGNSVRSIGIAAFGGTALTSLVIPNSVTSIAENAFADVTTLTSAIIGNSVRSIGNQAFAMATSLTNVTIGKCVVSIGDDVFNGATSLARVRFLSNASPTVGFNTFGFAPETATAIINLGATGFTRDAFNKWNGLNIETAEASDGCTADAPTAREQAAKREAEKQAARAEIINLFKNLGRATLKTLNQAEIFGITPGNIDQFHSEIFAMPESSRSEITEVLKIARKYEVVGIIGSERVASIRSDTLIEIGLISIKNKQKEFLASALRKLPESERTTYLAIKQAIEGVMAGIQARQDKLAVVLARIASRQKG